VRESGRVITVHDGAVDVRMEATARCGGCTSCSIGAGGETIMQGVLDRLGATVGDRVDVDIPDSVRPLAAAAVFGVPVACLFLGYLAGFLLSEPLGFDPDIAGLVAALASANIAVIGVRAADRRLARSERFTPQVSAIIARGHERP
jgi:positive regulator of sigma E activity